MTARADIVREFGPHPLTIIREAMSAAGLVGIRVRLGSIGVRREAARWVRDPEDDGVNPMGAAVLFKQPAEVDIDQATASAVNAPFAWAAGCADGLDRRAPADAWATSIKAREYSAGYAAGVWLRSQLLHNVRPSLDGGKV